MTLEAAQLAGARGGRALFSGLDFTVGAGEALWLRGANGSGKSSLLRMLAGLAEPAAGTVRWRGRDLHRQRDGHLRELLFIGHAPGLKDDLSASENLLFGAQLAGAPVDASAVAEALAAVGLDRVARLPVGRLSQGQRRRAALARLHLARQARLLLLDEPFAALDQASVAALVATLDRLLANGASLIYTTHQPQTLAATQLHAVDLDAHRPRPC